ncbi:pheromone A receptor-domain-containing protein [Desarmillaria tabescens]|uniref:Pheromone A receptor-domain-containing protein n=1 Tax=Armillaria tabescens TaxID=1929756 RepID=A0AA39N989_ARMTA|nr:pheromone A receptor-domain-containing protein [Desarmillaria tabescens]KAK0461401.1 pheromone A receptor-domain-containing protein [Desarmillaria tabescens]
MSPSNTVFAVFSVFFFLLVLVPTPCHAQPWNLGTLFFIFWLASSLIILFVDSVGAYCCRLLDAPLPSSQVSTYTVWLPLILRFVIEYAAQAHRFDIFLDAGCLPFTYDTALSITFVNAPSLILSLIAVGFSVASLGTYKYLKPVPHKYSPLADPSFPALSPQRYVRLLVLSIVVSVFNATERRIEAHLEGIDDSERSAVNTYPASVWRSVTRTAFGVDGNRWMFLIIGLTFLALFGTGEDVQKHYRRLFAVVPKSSPKLKLDVFAFAKRKQTAPEPEKIGLHTMGTILRPSRRTLAFQYDKMSFKDVGGLLLDAGEAPALPPSETGAAKLTRPPKARTYDRDKPLPSPEPLVDPNYRGETFVLPSDSFLELASPKEASHLP